MEFYNLRLSCEFEVTNDRGTRDSTKIRQIHVVTNSKWGTTEKLHFPILVERFRSINSAQSGERSRTKMCMNVRQRARESTAVPRATIFLAPRSRKVCRVLPTGTASDGQPRWEARQTRSKCNPRNAKLHPPAGDCSNRRGRISKIGVTPTTRRRIGTGFHVQFRSSLSSLLIFAYSLVLSLPCISASAIQRHLSLWHHGLIATLYLGKIVVSRVYERRSSVSLYF